MSRPPACDHPDFLRLQPLVGQWTVEASDRIEPGVFEETIGNATITTVAGGCVLMETYEGVRQGQSFHRLILLTATDDGQFEQVRLDSGHGQFTVSPGHAAGDTLIFEFARELPGRTLRTWRRYFDVVQESFRVAGHLQRSDDAEVERTYAAIYRRLP